MSSRAVPKITRRDFCSRADARFGGTAMQSGRVRRGVAYGESGHLMADLLSPRGA
jgi:hypothetical protein